MDKIQNLKDKILQDFDRMTADDTFSFSCHNKISCFNQCCRDVNIFLTPYDILRLKNRLGITSAEFLSKYTIMPVDKSQNLPIVQLKMDDSPETKCHFVTEQGCSVYEDRPWPCRMYPVGAASPNEVVGEDHFFFMMKEDVCRGFEEKREWTVQEWLDDQKAEKYIEFGELFKEVSLNEFFQSGKSLSPQQVQMYFTASYNLDDFHSFVTGSTFFDRFEIEEETKEKIKTDDEELLRFAFRWLRFALFSEPTIKIKKI